MQRVPSCLSCFKPFGFKGSGRPVGQRIPRLLCCGHTFCDGCLTKLAEIQPRGLKCPTCECETSLPGGKKQVKSLPTNLYILGILINNVRATIEKDISKGELSDFAFEKAIVAPTQDGRGHVSCAEATPKVNVKAKLCEECCDIPAVSKCDKCEALFCQSCFDAIHSSSRALSSHEAVPLALMQLAGMSVLECQVHNGRQLEFFDQTDEKLVCSLCVVTPACQAHKIVPAAEMAEDISKKVKENLEETSKVCVQLKKSREKLLSLFPTIKTECGEVIQHIHEHFQDLHTQLQAREVEFIKEVKDAYCQKSFASEVAKKIEQQKSELETLIEQGSMAISMPSVIVKVGETLLSKLAGFKDIPCVLSESFIADLVQISFPKEFGETFKCYGSVSAQSGSLVLRKLSEVDDITDETNEAAITSGQVADQVPENKVPARSGGTILSLPPRQNLVYITHIKNPCDFMIQYAADAERLENLMEAVNLYCDAAKGLNDAVKSTQVGDLVCAKYSKDQNWYRARIIGEQQQPNGRKGGSQPLPNVEVYFIDYGNTEVVSLSCLRKIQQEFTDVPELATLCSLVDIVPPGLCNTWPVQSIKAFGSLTRDKALLMSVVMKSGGKLYVDLKSPDDEPTQDDDKPASVRDALVFLEVAHFSSPASDPNSKVPFPIRTYKKVSLPEEGETVEVTVTYAESPDAVYVMNDSGKEYADTLRIISQMSTMYSTKKGSQWKIMWPYKGLVCAARFSGDQVWYRALVTGVSGDQVVQVFYVDFGNSEELPFSEIRRIPDHMTQLPMQAVKCRLAGIQPIDCDKGWSSECNAFLIDACSLNQYRMRVVEVEDDQPMSVVLYQKGSQQAMSVNQQLVQNLHATLKSGGDLESVQPGDVSEPLSPASSSGNTCGDEIGMSHGGGQELIFPQKLSYKPVKLPEASKFKLAITFVNKDCIISGYQPDNGDHSLPELMKHVQEMCQTDDNTSVSQEQLSFNQPCCAEFSEDNLWYRAEIIGFPSLLSVLVDYVDFGNHEEVPLCSINLTAAFLDIPKQCLSIQLHGLPQTLAGQCEVSEFLSSLLIGQTCEAVMVSGATVHGVLKCESLTLPDGTDVVETVGEMLSSHHGKRTIQSPSKNYPQGDLGKVKSTANASQSGQSLLSDTILPEKGVSFDVTVTQVDAPNLVYLQRLPPTMDDPGFAKGYDPTDHIANEHLFQLVKMSEKMNKPNFFKGKPCLKSVWNDMLCCAQYTYDDLWYRARVVNVESIDPLQALVLYFDYGTSEVIGLDRLKPFPAELLSLPKQAFQCRVAGLPEFEGDDPHSTQNLKAIDSVIHAVAGKKLICTIVSSEVPVVVELYDRVFSEESYQDILLDQSLSELELMFDAGEEGQDVATDEIIAKECEATPLLQNSLAEKGETSNAENGGAEVEDVVIVDQKSLDQPVEAKSSSTDVQAVHNWAGESEGIFAKFDKEMKKTRTQLLTPAQFLLKKENVMDDEKPGDVLKEDESEVD